MTPKVYTIDGDKSSQQVALYRDGNLIAIFANSADGATSYNNAEEACRLLNDRESAKQERLASLSCAAFRILTHT